MAGYKESKNKMASIIPLLPFPYKSIRSLIRGFYPVSSRLLTFTPGLKNDLSQIKSKFSAEDYLSGALIAFITYFVSVGSLLVIWGFKNNFLDVKGRLIILSVSSTISLAIFFYILIFPKWSYNKQKRELEKNLLFVVRHLMIQTSAGVPLFDAIVSVSKNYGDSNLDYGRISDEFRVIVKEVKSGANLTEALENSAKRNNSIYYRRIIWQLANANKSGANVGTILRDTIEFLSDEERIAVRSYGSQLNPLAMFYMLVCIIAPTMGLIFLIIASTFIKLPINDWLYPIILVFLIFIQIMFIGLIKSRRPTVSV